ncbi:MAG: hypothetical protein DRH93_21985, partial [Deltaproteobacteria bacterium]
YQADQNMKFQWGLAKFRDVFLCLKDIRRWDIQDRIKETGILEAWQEDLQHEENEILRFETELWFRGNVEKRLESEKQISLLIQNAGGKIISQCVIKEIAYHSMLGELPRNSMQELINHPATELVKCDSIMFFRPVGQITTDKQPVEGEFSEIQEQDLPEPSGDPVIALLDGLPLQNHYLLSNRLIIDDPDNWDDAYAATDRVHGTAMASLIIHGDLNDHLNEPLERPVYVRPIMKPIQMFDSPRPEQIPDNLLVVDLIHRAVRTIFEENEANLNIKIINLSIGDPSRQFIQLLSPLGRLIDWLSFKYNVLFVISAGNHITSLDTGVQKSIFEVLSNRKREEIIIKSLYEDARNRKLLSPAESINGVTVGALHHDNAIVDYLGDRIDFYENQFPSPVSSFGSGYRRSVKPDLIYPGGKLLYRKSLLQRETAAFEPTSFRAAPGNKVASPGGGYGALNNTAFCCGTSNSTALISRAAGFCYDSLLEIFEDQAPDSNYQAVAVPLLKAMVVHGCSWGNAGSRLDSILRTPNNGRKLKNFISRWLGYGVPDIAKVLDCTEQRASLLGFGQLKDGEAHVFRLPLPPSLGAKREKQKLTVTLAWLSPTAPNTQKYRTASLWFEVDNKMIASERSEAEWRSVRRGTVQHEIFQGEQAIPLADGDFLKIKINCRKDAAKIQNAISYGLVVSLEVAEGVDIEIYNEIRARVMPAVRVQQTF